MQFLKLFPLGLERNLVSFNRREIWGSLRESWTLYQIWLIPQIKNKEWEVLRLMDSLPEGVCSDLTPQRGPCRPLYIKHHSIILYSFTASCFLKPFIRTINNKPAPDFRAPAWWGWHCPSYHRGHGLNLCTRRLEDRLGRVLLCTLPSA